MAGARHWRGRGLRHRGQRAMDELPPRWRDNYRYLLVAAAVAGVGMWVWTGWPIHGLMTAGALAGLPFLLHPGGSAQRRIARLDALAQWLHQLASIHIAGTSLEQTIAASVGRAPTVLREPVAAAAVRLQQGVTPREVYALLADDLGDTAGDEVALLLMEHAEGRGPGLSAALSAAAQSAGAQAKTSGRSTRTGPRCGATRGGCRCSRCWW
ncbi:type II secretion system F family protein [Streptomyces sp. CA-250714]|uniref:type II secretion system F family protein n=1 Tax=Streptomyces sp. CA-250714 TaxID=3240060 RepID=UPI003D93E7C6